VSRFAGGVVKGAGVPDNRRMRFPTAALAATGLIAGYGVAVVTGSRPLGGLLLAVCGIGCIAVWAQRHGARLTSLLAAGGLCAFALSHALGLLIGAWPAVLVTAAATAAAYWRLSDSRAADVAGASASARP
jgi:hypothetical protein